MQGMSGNGGTQRPLDERLIRSLNAGREALFVLGSRPVDRRLVVSVNSFHARHVREQLGRTYNITDGSELPEFQETICSPGG